MTLRDLSLPGNSGANGNLHHRIDVYFYDKWADDHHSGIGPGDDLEVTRALKADLAGKDAQNSRHTPNVFVR